ncbi:MAG TPA: molybdate ABC transporter substrate-binding protein [Candidatus Sulfotelmatobacter sp.]|nr:molybdate ABC transporter substrate-binding protein [Candidatus Sulfotelmatobacter sp.]
MRSLRACLAMALVALSVAPLPVAGAPAPVTLHVFAAASLSEAFDDLAKQFDKAHAGCTVQLNLAGSQQLVAQIESGAPADVFASADTAWMGRMVRAGRVAGEPLVFARNRLVLVIPRSNPAHLDRLQDLAKPGIKLVLGAETVPVGRYSREVLKKLSAEPGFGADFSDRVLKNLASEEENVKSVASKVALNEADAGIVYHSDVTQSVAKSTRTIAIPDSSNVLATYPIAALSTAASPELARAFVALAISPAGQKTLERHGMIAAGVARP